MAIINVKSFDFDGSIFNLDYISSSSPSRLIDANHQFISQVSKSIQEEKVDEVVILVGSNRQSLAIDQLNSDYGKGSCFPALLKLAQEFQRQNPNIPHRIDPYLLADSYGNRPLGENFIKAIGPESERKKYPFSDYLFDDTKLSMLYAQMHKLASENPNDQIIFDFYDDRIDILMHLTSFFQSNPNLIPANVKLRLHQYDGTSNEINPQIHKLVHGIVRGKGKIDFNYQNNTKKLGKSLKNIQNLDDFIMEGLDEFVIKRNINCDFQPTYADILPSMKLTTRSRMETINKAVCDKLASELNHFLDRRRVSSYEELSEENQARYQVMDNLRRNIMGMMEEKQFESQQAYDSKLESAYREKLDATISAALLNNKLDKYNELEKVGIYLLNVISFIFAPIKRILTGTWFYSAEGKPKEAVQDLQPMINRLLSVN